jgi:diguanylate cyclase (GGDEF)-like protein/PAS domain S-box-containing protein
VSRRTRSAVVLVTAASLTAAAADATWAATDDASLGIGLWLVMIALLGCSTLTEHADIWAGAGPRPSGPQLARLPQLVVVPGLLSAISVHPEPVTVALAVSLLLALGAELALTGSQLRSLWARSEEQTRQLDTVLSGSRDAILWLSATGVVRYANPAAEGVLGHPLDTLLGASLGDLVHRDDIAAHRHLLGARAVTGEAVRASSRFRRADGTWRYLESTVSGVDALPGQVDDVGGMVVIARDVSERVMLEEELRREATTDSLTGLLNRQAFLVAVADRLARGTAAVLYLDLDDFKTVNDTRGHEAGDELLIRVAHTLAVAAGPARSVARLGGDEFAVLVPISDDGDAQGGEDLAAVEALAARLVAELTRRQGSVGTGVSIGLAVGRGSAVDEVLGDADLAMYAAKGAGGGRVAVFEPAMRERVVARAQLREDLERAISDGALSIDLQPIVELGTGAWVGFEALVRWPDAGRVRPPSEFVPLAEETGLIVPLGTWVLRAALAWLATWPDRTAGVSVNVTGRQVAEPGFADLVRAELTAAGLEPSRLTLELTEQTAVEDLDRAGAVLQPLRAAGVHVALDDFGTGYSSLGYLARLPVDELKIDRRFVSGLGRRAEDDALVRAVLRLAEDLGLEVVAEGVESTEQAATLRGYGCPLAQGYLYARPVPYTAIRRPADAVTSSRVPRQVSAARRGLLPG